TNASFRYPGCNVATVVFCAVAIVKPSDAPAEVTYFPASTQRETLSHSTSGPLLGDPVKGAMIRRRWLSIEQPSLGEQGRSGTDRSHEADTARVARFACPRIAELPVR